MPNTVRPTSRKGWNTPETIEVGNVNLWPVSISDKTSYCKISKPRDLYLELSDRSEIWQAPRQQGCRSAGQISKRCDNLNHQSRGFETSRDCKEVPWQQAQSNTSKEDPREESWELCDCRHGHQIPKIFVCYALTREWDVKFNCKKNPAHSKRDSDGV